MPNYTNEQLATLRRMIGDDTPPYMYTDTDLANYLDANLGDFNKTAGVIWHEKAAVYARSVDITEAGSSRKESDKFDNALAMAKFYDDQNAPPDVAPTTIASTTRRIVRR